MTLSRDMPLKAHNLNFKSNNIKKSLEVSSTDMEYKKLFNRYVKVNYYNCKVP